MIIATTPFIAGHRVTETKGQVFGLVVRSRVISPAMERSPAIRLLLMPRSDDEPEHLPLRLR